jgi:hypothetical protein
VSKKKLESDAVEEAAVAVEEPKKPRTLEEAMASLEEKKLAEDAANRKRYRETALRDDLSDEEQFEFIALMKTMNKSVEDYRKDRQVLLQIQNLQNELAAKPLKEVQAAWKEAQRVHSQLLDDLRALEAKVSHAEREKFGWQARCDHIDHVMMTLAGIGTLHADLLSDN